MAQSKDEAIIIDTSIHFIKPDKFYISGIIDSREDKIINDFAVISYEKDSSIQSRLSLQQTLKTIIRSRLNADSNLAPVVIDIKEFRVAPDVPKDQLKIELRFQSVLSGQNVDFAFYTYTRDAFKYITSPKYLSGLLRKELPHIIVELNELINNLYNDFPFKGTKAVNSIKSNLTSTADTFYYNPKQRLSLKDFEGKPDISSIATAVTASGFRYDCSSILKDGLLTIDINTICYFNKKNSWVREELASPAILKHEQVHFDITYLWALKFSKRINAISFSSSIWKTQLSDLYREYSDRMTSMQNDYDAETQNGIRDNKQNAWQKKIQQLIHESLPEEEGFLPGLTK